MRPRLLDLFCCQGGASAGYDAAGFDVVGVDLEPQPRYPFAFHQGDALAVLDVLLSGWSVNFSGRWLKLGNFAAVHASPPCQAWTNCQKIRGNTHPELVEPTRVRLERTGLPYVIENVEGAPLLDSVALCGSMFGLETYRHRLFESNVELAAPDHPEHVVRTTKMGRTPIPGEFMHIVGNFSGVERGRQVMGMPWASRDGLREAIPPAYSEFVGRSLLAAIDKGAAA